jgi:hypothetical protein
MKVLVTISAMGILAFSALLLPRCNVDLPYHPTQFIPPKFVIPVADRDSVKSFIGAPSYNFKLAFVSGTVYVVDFNVLETDEKTGKDFPQVVRLQNDPQGTGKPSSPLISPDGSLATYFLFGGPTAQTPYVQKIANGALPVALSTAGTDPHFWTGTDGKLYSVYSDKWQLNFNTLSSLTGYSTFRQQIDPLTGAPVSPRTVLADKPFNGGLSRNGRYLCTGYQDGGIYDLLDSTLHLINHTDPSKPMQICNPSISPDSVNADWMLFLNFEGVQQVGYAAGVAPLPKINIHDYLLIVDKTNTVQWYIQCPADHYEWQCPEWTNDFNFVVALAKVTNDDADGRYDCYLIRRSDHALLKLTTGDFKLDGTSTPSFWIGR